MIFAKINASKGKDQSMLRIKNIILSLFFIGNIPWAPGTWGSLATMILFYPFLNVLTPLSLSFILLMIFLVSWPLTHQSIATSSNKDPSWIVIDEFLGQGLSLLILMIFCDLSDILLLLSFVSFRFFDITKIQPARYFDSQHSALGLILDDLVAGFYSGFFTVICCQLYITLL